MKLSNATLECYALVCNCNCIEIDTWHVKSIGWSENLNLNHGLWSSSNLLPYTTLLVEICHFEILKMVFSNV